MNGFIVGMLVAILFFISIATFGVITIVTLDMLEMEPKKKYVFIPFLFILICGLIGMLLF